MARIGLVILSPVTGFRPGVVLSPGAPGLM